MLCSFHLKLAYLKIYMFQLLNFTIANKILKILVSPDFVTYNTDGLGWMITQIAFMCQTALSHVLK